MSRGVISVGDEVVVTVLSKQGTRHWVGPVVGYIPAGQAIPEDKVLEWGGPKAREHRVHLPAKRARLVVQYTKPDGQSAHVITPINSSYVTVRLVVQP